MNEAEQYKQFSDKMEADFPAMFSGRYGGFAIGPGWYSLIETLCQNIQQHIDQSKGNCPQVIVEQIKEKFGGLRFYYQGGDEFIHGAVWLAESLSMHICEECGAPAERRHDGWIKSLCHTHYIERENKRREFMKEGGFEE
jgi:hypothetical protein